MSDPWMGVDIGGTGIKVGLVDPSEGRMIGERVKLPTPRPATPERVVKTLEKASAELGSSHPVGIGFPRDAPYRLSSLGLMQARLALVASRAQIRAVAVPLPLAGTALELHASRRTPRISCNGDATKIEE